MKTSSPRFAIVAGEDSGDILGADLIVALKKRYPNAVFEGIGGRRMCAQGMISFYPLERLAVMGIFEPLKRLPELMSIYFHLKRYFLATRPTAFIGIDAPDFNLRLEKRLKCAGIKTVHYVSPTIWAWRPNRIKTIKKSVDLMLGLFPFEKSIYDKNQIPMAYVGHPLADSIPMDPDKIEARRKLNLEEARYVALMPGSRRQELDHLVVPFLETAQWLYKKDPSLRFVTACVNEAREQQFRLALQAFPALPVEIFLARSMEVMTASEVILLASGTASLQAMLLKKPSVVAYKMSSLSYKIVKRLIKVAYIALPNLLAGKALMPEYIQNDVIAEKMGAQIWEWLCFPANYQATLKEFEILHQDLRKNAGHSAAIAIDALIKENLCKKLQESTKWDGVH